MSKHFWIFDPGPLLQAGPIAENVARELELKYTELCGLPDTEFLDRLEAEVKFLDRHLLSRLQRKAGAISAWHTERGGRPGLAMRWARLARLARLPRQLADLK